MPTIKMILKFPRAARRGVVAAVGGIVLAMGPSVTSAAEVTYERLLNPEPHNWLMVHRDYASQRYSALDEINQSNIKNLRLKFAFAVGGTSPNDPPVALVRWFNMTTGAPSGEIRVPRSTGFNDIEVADDGTIYATQTGVGAPTPDPMTWQVWKITRDGSASIFIQGAPLRQPNGIAFDQQGNIVVINIGNDEVLTFSPAGRLIRTENAVQPGNDGLVIMADGTKYVSSVLNGGVSRIRPGRPAELIAQNIPSPASMCYDAGANQLVIPMNANNALAFIPLN